MEEVMEMAEVKVMLIAQVKVMLRSKLKSRSMSVMAISLKCKFMMKNSETRDE